MMIILLSLIVITNAEWESVGSGGPGGQVQKKKITQQKYLKISFVFIQIFFSN